MHLMALPPLAIVSPRLLGTEGAELILVERLGAIDLLNLVESKK
jgi:hypothetical protein